MQIADVYASLVLDTSGVDDTLQKDLPAKADAAGQEAGSRFGSKLASAAKPLIGAGIGAAVGAIFSSAAQGAAELDSAMSQFAADTGATQEELKAASETVTSLFGSNLQSMSEITDALAAMRTDLGMTQEEADAAAGSFLAFATATRQDASQAVLAFDDILDAWGLEATDAAGIMDKLVYSHQQYGGSVEANQAALSALAPAMKAANLTVDDGIGVLNMFAASGIDANTATTAFSKALTKVKSPEQLKQMIADISAIEDPFARAQAAAELFGAKAGPKMASALAQGGLDTFMVSLDQAAGSAEAAAGQVEGSFTNMAEMVSHQFTGALTSIGSNFGPLILGFSSLVPMLGPIMTTAGGALGGLLAAAIPIGMAAWPVLLAAAIAGGIALLIANPGIVTAITDFASGLIQNVVSFLSGLPEALLGVLQGAFDFLVANGPSIIAGLVGFLLELPLKITELQVNFLSFFANLFVALVQALPGMIQGVVDFLVNLPDRIGDLTNTMALLFVNIGIAVRAKVVEWLGEVGETISGLPDKVVALVGDLAQVALDAGTAFRKEVEKWVQDIIDLILGIPGEVLKLVGKFIDLGTAIAKAIANGLITVLNSVISAVVAAINSLQIHVHLDLPDPLPDINFDWNGLGLSAPQIPLFAEGTPYVPETGLAILHKGEAVVPADEAKKWQDGQMGNTLQIQSVVIQAETFTGSEVEAEAAARRLFDRLDAEARRRGMVLGGSPA